MLFSPVNLIKRYTPPTCILEIYQKNSLIPWVKSNSEQIKFQLHFDDPRLPQEEKVTLNGDHNLLGRLRDQVSEYIKQYLSQTIIERQKIDNQTQLSLNSSENYDFLLIKTGLCHHQLLSSLAEKQIINLSNTQLFDLGNALENYHLESTFITTQHKESQGKKLSLIASLLGLVSVIGGFWWWRNHQIIANKNQTDDSLELSSEQIIPNVESLIPPSPLDPSTIPPIVSPRETEDMQNRAKLPPPPPTLTQPPLEQNSSGIAESLPQLPSPRTTSVTTQPNQVLPPPPPPSLPPASLLPAIPNANNNVIAINPTPQALPQPSLPSINSLAPTSPDTTNFQPRLSRLPVLESSNSQSVANSDSEMNLPENQRSINQVSINQAPNLIPPSREIEQSRLNQPLTTNPVTQEIKQYFQAKWQPPENLTQSIEYRLLVDQNGSLMRITPIGQVANVFLDQTGMPLLGEPIMTSSLSQSATIRLILSPNGNVQTFQE